jgi:8-oxo-dGTP pyrophosphatase MutT (NUDIX family)
VKKDIIGKKPAWMYRQSGVVPFYNQDGILNTIIITSTSNGCWVFPKGVIEKGMTASESALKEAYEEAGLKGTALGKAIGKYEYEKWSGICEVEMYIMEVEEILETWEDKDERKRLICTVTEALGLIENIELRKMLSIAGKEWEKAKTAS